MNHSCLTVTVQGTEFWSGMIKSFRYCIYTRVPGTVLNGSSFQFFEWDTYFQIVITRLSTLI